MLGLVKSSVCVILPCQTRFVQQSGYHVAIVYNGQTDSSRDDLIQMSGGIHVYLSPEYISYIQQHTAAVNITRFKILHTQCQFVK